MVRFEKDRYVVEICTLNNPAEAYSDLLKGIYELIRNMPAGEQIPDNFYAVIDFLQELLPEWADLKKLAM